MTVSLKFNLAAYRSTRLLGKATKDLQSSFEKLSSGMRINKASDDAAGLAIADSLKADQRVYRQGVRNLNDGVSALNIADGALDAMSNVTTRLIELSEQAANGVYTKKQREALDREAQLLAKEYNRIARSAEFNGVSLFDAETGKLSLQAGYGVNGILEASLGGGMGDGTFTRAATLPYTEPPLHVGSATAAADVNGDGHIDMAVATTSFGGAFTNVSILISDGYGGFTEEGLYTFTGEGLSDVHFGDFNGDGIVDLNVAFVDTTTNNYLGNGDGTFGDAIVNNFTSNHNEVADINGDGISDLVYTSSGPNTPITVQFGDSTGAFSTSVQLAVPAGANPRALQIFDYNGDGNEDIIVSHVGTAGYSVYSGNGQGDFTLENTGGVGGISLTTGDFNNDGLDDFALEGNGVFLSAGDGTFSSSTVPGSTGSFVAADIDGDGNVDLLSHGGGLFHKGDGTGGFATGVATGIAPGGLDLTLADFNNDGVLDGLTNIISTDNQLFIANTTSGVSALQEFSLQQQFTALAALSEFKEVNERLASQRSIVGAFRSRIESATRNLAVSAENFAAAESRIRDVDIAEESAKLTRTQILQQAAAAVLGQANTLPQLALRLLQI